jgi:glycosyltransferase 2 family protein
MQTQDSPLSTPSRSWRRYLTWLVVALAGVWCVNLLRQDLGRVRWEAVASCAPAIWMALGLSILNFSIRAFRWHVYMRASALSDSWRFSSMTFMAGFAFTISPGKVGELVRARYYLRHPDAMGHISGAFFVERLLDLLVMVLFAAMILTELSQYSAFLWGTLALVALSAMVLILAPWARWTAHLRSHTGSRRRWAPIALSMLSMMTQARLYLSPAMVTSGFALGLLAWSAEALGVKLIVDALVGQTLSFEWAAGSYAMAIIVGALSFLPGGLGSTEAVMAGLLSVKGLTVPDAILATLIWRLVTLWFAVLLGWLCVWRLSKQSTSR